MRTEVPSPGRALPFNEWSAAIVAGGRAYLPDAKAVRKGSRIVFIRHGGREARLRDHGSEFWITFSAGSVATTMASMYDTRHDAFVVGKFAKSPAISMRGSPRPKYSGWRTGIAESTLLPLSPLTCRS